MTRGLSDFIGQEEFDEESGFWWSPGCDRIAYLEVDERKVDVVPVMGYRDSKRRPDAAALPARRDQEPGGARRHPRPQDEEDDLARRSPGPGERYLGRFQWSPDGKALWFQALSRDQQPPLASCAPTRPPARCARCGRRRRRPGSSSSSCALLEQIARACVATTVVDGHHHLELRDGDTGARLALLTRGDWDVESIAGVDEDARPPRARFARARLGPAPLERRLYSPCPSRGGEIDAPSRPSAASTRSP